MRIGMTLKIPKRNGLGNQIFNVVKKLAARGVEYKDLKEEIDRVIDGL